MRIMIMTLVFTFAAETVSAEPISVRDGLQPLNDLIGVWKGTGIPEGSRADQQRGFWIETMSWEWRFKGSDAWLTVDFREGKHFRRGELRYLPDRDRFQLTLKGVDDNQHVFTGRLEKRVLTLHRETDVETQRLTFRLLHANRFLYTFAVCPPSKTLYSPRYQVGVTKADGTFAQGSGQPECIVSGGLGTMAVSYQGKTYFVCCSGCREEFNADPEKYVKEWEAKRRK